MHYDDDTTHRPEEALESRLRTLPTAQVPVGFTDAVMSSITTRPKPWWATFHRSISEPRTIRFSPLRAALSAACLFLVFGLGFLGGRHFGEPIPDSVAIHEAAEASYTSGRGLLAAMRPEEALPLLDRAARLNPDNPDYAFWAGVAYWALGDQQNEALYYKRVVSRHPHHTGSRLYLGHNYLDRGRYADAIEQYDALLDINPNALTALYNKGLALRALDQREAAAQSWKRLLDIAPYGIEAASAVEMLNATGDFSYRLHYVGRQTLVLPSLALTPTNQSGESLDGILRRVGRTATLDPALVLHIVVYIKGNAAIAKAQAHRLRDRLLELFPNFDPNRVKPSWFDVPERGNAGETAFSLNESVRFIGLAPSGGGKEGSRI